MMSLEQLMQTVMEESAFLPQPDLNLTVSRLAEDEKAEVLGFLAERPIHTVIMMGLIRDNGVVSDLNRGTFYACRNSEGRLEGVGLIGHATLLEARTRGAVRELALAAHHHDGLHMFMAEQTAAEQFWNAYADEGQAMRFACRELLFKLDRTPDVRAEIADLRLATILDLDLVAPVHAAMAEAESGINPLETDREPFLARCARRIYQKRVWILVRDGKLLFKADLQAETPEMVYLEGVYSPEEFRGSGIARSCLTQLCNTLLAKTRSVCLLVNEENLRAQALYRMCGFKCISQYDTIFLKPERSAFVN